MKKTVIILVMIIIFYIFIGSVGSQILIPNEALRVRVIANSNSYEDQFIKKEVRDNLSNYLYEILENTERVSEARTIINSNLENIDNNVSNTLHAFNSNQKYDVNFGLNYFPSKKYKGITYDEGYYESLVITLGNGSGDNWWCVMFPPLCLLEAEESTDVEYKSFVKEMIDKYF